MSVMTTQGMVMAPEESTEELRQWIQEELDLRGWSMREASLKAKLSENRISQIMRGGAPGLQVCMALAILFNKPLGHVMFLAGYSKRDPFSRIDPELEDLARRIGEADDDVREKLIKVILTLLDNEDL